MDIRTKGSGNAGASNVTITLGWRWGILVAAMDIAKAWIAVVLCRTLFPGVLSAGAAAGIFCILGHIFPFYLGFRGGKGFASYIGMMLALNWRITLVLVAATVVITVVTDYIALATLATSWAFPVWQWYAGSPALELVLLGLLAVIIFWKHRENLRRIRRGEETGLRKVPVRAKR